MDKLRSIQLEVDLHVETVDTASYTPLSAQHNPSFCHDLLSRRSHASAVEPQLDVDLLCVNCYECLTLDEVDSHSQICAASEKELHVNSKLHKLHTAAFNKRQTATADKAWALAQVETLALAALQPAENVQVLADRADEVAEAVTLMSDGHACLVFARRLQSLLEEKADEEFSKWKVRIGVLLELAGARKLSEEFSGEVSREFSEEWHGVIQEPSGKLHDLATSLDKLRWFYWLGIQRKAELPNNSPAVEIPISEVYEEALQLPVSAWEEYIAQIFE